MSPGRYRTGSNSTPLRSIKVVAAPTCMVPASQVERVMDMKTIMVHPELERPNDGLFALTADLAQRLGAAEVIGITGCQPIQLVYDETYVAGEIMAADREEIEVEMKRAEQRFRDMFKGGGRRLEWRCNITPAPLADYIASEARAADLVIT